MQTFATLIQALDSTNKTSAKTAAIHQFLEVASETDKVWLLSLFTGKRPKRAVNSKLLREWAMELSHVPEWLFIESYAAVGDLGETIALILPPPTHTVDISLSQWMDEIIAISNQDEEAKKQFVLNSWKRLNLNERFIFNKLLGGSFRVGVSSKGMINALAQYYQLDEAAVAHSIMGDWKPAEVNFEALVRGAYTDTNLSKPYPFCLAYALEQEIEELSPITDWQIEYKWDGIRGQIIKRQAEIHIWSRGEELVTPQFPEIVNSISTWKGDFVLDGELLPIKDESVLDFSELQKRLNRKSISNKMLEETPVGLYVYDILEIDGQDLRQYPLKERRKILEQLINNNPSSNIHLSTIIADTDIDIIKDLRANARNINSEGLMLKHKLSIYHTGRKKSDWWKWKIDPFTIDAVLIYAQKGSGRRSAHYTDYTFAIRAGDQLVTIAKAYSGLTDKEIQEVSKFVNKNAIEKFGPVRTVKPELVFEIAFEGIAFSNRHKSGIALRFPRIARWRKDKTVKDIDDIESVKKLIK